MRRTSRGSIQVRRRTIALVGELCRRLALFRSRPTLYGEVRKLEAAMRIGITTTALLAFVTIFVPDAFATLSVTAPPAGSTTISAGNDYATQVIGDAWDMNNVQDIDTDESALLSPQTIAGGIFSATNTDTVGACNAYFYPLFMGYGTQTVAIARGQRFPIDNSQYRYLTMKLKATAGASAQQDRIFYYENGDSTGNGRLGGTSLGNVTPNAWNVQTWDLATDTLPPPYFTWTSLSQVRGIRVALCNAGSPNLQVDWIRITAPPSAGQSYTVTWTDTGSTTTYAITAIDGDMARYQFATGISGTSYSANFSRLAPGDYHVEVKRADNTTATSTGVVHVNIPPQVNISAPSVRGEPAKSYAITQQGGQWGPMSATDFAAVVNFKNVVYTNPVGSFSGRPLNNDPEFIMKTAGHTIDASLYRSACFTQQVFGTRSVGSGSVARFFWGPSSSSVSTTTDIVLGNGLVEYCLPDLADTAAVPLVPGSPQPWAGNIGYFRMDPDELTPAGGCSTPQTCFDVRLDSIILAPFATASPIYTVHWTVTDADFVSGGSIQIFLDPDTTFDNGNEIGVATVPYTAGSYTLVADKSIPNGTYYLVLLADDGRNAVAQYAGGKIVTDSADIIFRDGFETGT
jgi:hypothetical protein